ncbi:unnamed protein product [Ceutorhynchus assimilis]|uniref:Uncharacterized protein n=1 Tax=Ceutorhynchus assimilis TaxID=467358 RepID=A0A9N9MSB1_9CUCU|nr:unnamed protein product [Ceutorhynchus assimilis]
MESSGKMVECIVETGKTLNTNNQGIIKYLCGMEEERNNLGTIIQKQFEEREKIESDIEKLTFKLGLINKSLTMRIKTKNNYDKTIDEIKVHYEKLVDSSNNLREIVEKTQTELDSLMNKKIGTGTQPEEDEIKILYIKPFANDDQPTKEKRPHNAPAKWDSIIGEKIRKSQEKITNKKVSSEKTIIIADLSGNKANGKRIRKPEKSLQKESEIETEIIHNNKPMIELESSSGKVTDVTSSSNFPETNEHDTEPSL